MLPFFSAVSRCLTDQAPISVDSELWLAAELRTQEILFAIQPAVASEKKRKDVIDYIKWLMKHHYGILVVPFGSVPLRTYLPDGDIDLTALIHPSIEENLATDLCRILNHVEEDIGCQVKDIQYIQAQVKIVKCCVKNIPVDISFNQVAGLYALFFLEQVDQFIGKDHLLKRSIILIKAWCFYESRILGAHHGLISTYALEILVLCIINLFHSSLPGPLAVLDRFLNYYSKFDWDNYGVSIFGPIAMSSSLPKVTAESTESKGNGLLFSREFLWRFKEVSSAATSATENAANEFPVKYLNIVDPLKDGNNLGRSVSKGNFHRIKFALSFGAQKLAETLKKSGEGMMSGLEKLFKNTLDRNGRGQRPDAQVPVPAFGTGRTEVCDLHGECNGHLGYFQQSWLNGNQTQVWPHLILPSQIQERSATDSLPLFQCKPNAFLQNSVDVLSPKARNWTHVFVPILPAPQPCYTEIYAATHGINTFERSRGTGTYIPNMSCHPLREFQSCTRARTPPPRTLGQWTGSQETDSIDIPPDTEKSGNKICLELQDAQGVTETHILEKREKDPGGQGESNEFEKFGRSASAMVEVELSTIFNGTTASPNDKEQKSTGLDKIGVGGHQFQLMNDEDDFLPHITFL